MTKLARTRTSLARDIALGRSTQRNAVPPNAPIEGGCGGGAQRETPTRTVAPATPGAPDGTRTGEDASVRPFGIKSGIACAGCGAHGKWAQCNHGDRMCRRCIRDRFHKDCWIVWKK